jgi:hypothetical protein
MSASNYNWVCFECRTTRRHPKMSDQIPLCPDCGRECFCLGYKVEVPRREAVREWRQLREECWRRLHARQDHVQRSNVRRQHDLEKEITRMEALGENKDRERQINKLKEELRIKRRF